MKEILKSAFFIFAIFPFCNYGQPRSQTFLSLREPFESGSPERETFTRHFPHNEASFFQVVPLWGHSSNGIKIAQFFMPFGKNILLVTEDAAAGADSRDLSADNFNIKTINDTFKSQMLVCASHQFFGAGIAARQQFWTHWWWEFGIPILKVENSMSIREKIINDGDGVVDERGLDNSPYVGSMKEAFRQPTWNFGRIDGRKTHSREGFGDLEVKLGYNYHACATKDVWLNGYLGFIFPTSNKPTGRFVFEPMLGNNGHYGVMYGSHLDFCVWCCDAQKIDLVIDINTRYLLTNKQLRSFDLRDKEFSRYIASYKNARQSQLAEETDNPNSGTSGINLYTQCVRVSPGLSVSLLGAFRYTHESFELEAGYNFYARQAEVISINWNKTPAVRDEKGLGFTNHARTMTDNFPGSAIPANEYVPLLGKDLDLRSAESPSAMAYTFYGAVGYYLTTGECPILLGFGASYGIGVVADINQWTTWGKIEMAY